MAAKTDQLERLRQRVRAIERGGENWNDRDALPVQAAWGPMPRSLVHEWLGVGVGLVERSGTDQPQASSLQPQASQRSRAWSPPLCLLSDLVRRAQRQEGGWVFWIGQHVRPHAAVLAERQNSAWPCRVSAEGAEPMAVADRCVFVQARTADEVLWAADVAARSPAAAAVVLDGQALDMAATRRLQLAAEAGGALVIACRPVQQMDHLSAAAYRWRIDRMPGKAPRPRWSLSLLRCKDASASCPARSANTYVLEWNHATRTIAVAAELGDRSRAAASAAIRQSA